MATNPTKPATDGDAASDLYIQFVDSTYNSPPSRYERAKDETEARKSAGQWKVWVAETLRANLTSELEAEGRRVPPDPIRIAALQEALEQTKSW